MYMCVYNYTYLHAIFIQMKCFNIVIRAYFRRLQLQCYSKVRPRKFGL